MLKSSLMIISMLSYCSECTQNCVVAVLCDLTEQYFPCEKIQQRFTTEHRLIIPLTFPLPDMYTVYLVNSTFSSLQLTNTGAPIKAKLKATLALAAMATRQVHTLSMSTA